MATPSDRYNKLETKTLPDGKIVYKSAIPKSVTPDPLLDIQIPASDIIRMDVIAYNVYGSAQEWWRLAAANKKVNGSLYMTPGSYMIIPRG